MASRASGSARREICPGFAVTDVVFESGEIEGVITGDMGVPRRQPQGHLPANTPCSPKVRGARLPRPPSWKLGARRRVRPAEFGIGLKEATGDARPRSTGRVWSSTLGWPLDDKTGGGSFLYHFGERAGVGGLCRPSTTAKTPTSKPFKEFQRAKTHPLIAEHLHWRQAHRLWRARLTEGGYQAIPQLRFSPGGDPGRAAGFMNVPRIKGSHNAMLSGMMAAEAAFAAIEQGRSRRRARRLSESVRGRAPWRKS